VCVQQCPYGAIELRPRGDGLPYESLAVVNAGLCTGCGLCVGACSTDAIDLLGLATAAARGPLLRAIAAARAQGQRPVAVFACARQVTSGTIPAAHDGAPVITCAVPCAGMVHGEWVRQSLLQGAAAAIVVGGPHDDCAYREGPRWLHERLRRREKLQRLGAGWLEVAPGDRSAVQAAMTHLLQRAGGAPPVPAARRAWPRLALRLAAGLAPLLLIGDAVATLAEWRTAAPAAGDGQLRFVVAHKGAIKQAASGLSHREQARLPDGVSAAQILGGERHPVRLRIEIDGVLAAEREYRPAGVHKEGASHGLELLPATRGVHEVRVQLMDDGSAWRTAYDGRVQVEDRQVRILVYDPAQDAFDLR
jgi:coenzyme F420-reducing hydrogenase delta subunit/NAD-dependent dihydropyrimidine dehydrogenase PreA subunit